MLDPTICVTASGGGTDLSDRTDLIHLNRRPGIELSRLGVWRFRAGESETENPRLVDGKR